MSKSNAMRGARRSDARRKQANRVALNVFLRMQMRPLRQRLRLARCLVFQSDLRYFARKQGTSVQQVLAESKQKKEG